MITKNVLLVENDFFNRRLLKNLILKENYVVYEAKNANIAIEILKNNHIDVALLDINLGENEVDGITIGRILQNEFHIPFIYLTAYETIDIVEKAVATSPYAYITKPYKNTDLSIALALAIKKHKKDQTASKSLIVKDNEFQLKIAIDDIDYLVSEKNYLFIYSNDKIYKYRSTIKEILTLLPQSQFFQIHRAYIVNKSKIDKFNLKTIQVREKSLPISRKYMVNFSLS